jgi:UDP-glucose 4-epimerase
MKSLIIGGAGFIGSCVAWMLSETGRDVCVLDRLPHPKRKLPPKATYISGDLKDREFLRTVLTDVSEVVDLAYSTVPKTSFDDPVHDILSNLPPGVILLQEAAQINLEKLVFVSSGGAVYGKAERLPIDELHPTNPISPYGITKLTMEKYVGMFKLFTDLPAAIARPGNAYGEEQAAFTGQGFIATAIHSIFQAKKVDVFGRHGTIRDYLHVSDIARGIIAIIEHGQAGQIYNIGSSIGRNNIDVLDSIRPLASTRGLDIQINFLPERAFDVPANILSSQKLYSISGWQPQITFEEGIQRVWDSLLSNQTNRLL